MMPPGVVWCGREVRGHKIHTQQVRGLETKVKGRQGPRGRGAMPPPPHFGLPLHRDEEMPQWRGLCDAKLITGPLRAPLLSLCLLWLNKICS